MGQYWQQEPSKAEPHVQINSISSKKKTGKYFRPILHRTPAISFLIIIALVLIGLIEFSLRKLPHRSTSFRPERPHVHKRQDPDLDALINQLSTQIDALSAAIAAPTSQPKFTAAPASKFLNDAVSTQTLAASSSKFLNNVVSTQNLNGPTPAQIITKTVGNNIILDVSGTLYTHPASQTAPESAPTSAFLKPDVKTAAITTQVASGLPESAFLNPTISTNQVTDTPKQTVSPLTVGAPPSSAFLKTNVETSTAHSSTHQRVVGGSQTSSTSDIARPTELASLIESDKPLQFVQKPVNYFYAIYLPVLLAIIFRMFMSWLYTTTKMMEPFSMLSKLEGVKAKDFLFTYYLAGNDSLAPLTALFKGHWLMLWMAITYVAVQLLSALSSEIFAVYPSFHIKDGQSLSGGAVWVKPRIARLMQGILAFICLMLINIRFRLRKSQAQIYSDPSSIVGMASLLHHPGLIQDFESIPQDAKKKDIHHGLADKRYRLSSYQAFDGTERYGIVSGTRDPNTKTTTYFPNPQPISPFPTSSMSREKSSTRKQIAQNTLFFLITIGLLGLIIAYHLNTADNGFERFMDAQSFGPRFILTVAGMLVKSGWSRLERRSVVFDPFNYSYNNDSSSKASVQSIALPTRPLIPIQTLFASLYRGRLFSAMLAFTALTAEALIIVLPGVPFEVGQVYLANLSSRYVSISILSFMLLIMAVSVLKALVSRGNKPQLPKDPNTIGALILYLGGTRLSEEVSEMAVCEGKEIKRELGPWKRGMKLSRVNRMEDERWILDVDNAPGGA